MQTVESHAPTHAIHDGHPPGRGKPAPTADNQVGPSTGEARYGEPVAQPKIVLYYVFTPLADPEAVRLWQWELAGRLGLKGRVVISPQGINATLGGEHDEMKGYVKATRRYAPFHEADIKWALGTGDDFPRLSVKVRPELVTFGAPDELTVDETGIVDGGVRLTPKELHALVAERGEDVVFFDGRNSFESGVGRFRNAVTPAATTTRDFLPLLDSGEFDHLKGRPVVTYCTGGVRCEVLTSLMRHRGFQEVYQLDGGIVRYGETFGDDGLWDGSLYVFDGRKTVTFSDHAASLGRCENCGRSTDRFEDVDDGVTRRQVLRCGECPIE